MGDDEVFEFLYKFVSRGRLDPARGARNGELLDEGTLHVARFEDDGTGCWLPLRFGEGPLVPEQGFADAGEVLVHARLAGTAVGATPMDRPEDVEVDGETGRVFLALTNNKLRKGGDETAPNPRAPNRHGHVIEIQEDGDDAAATTFRWSVLLLGGPAEDGGTARGDVLSCPDNLAMGPGGRLWVATDGQPGTLRTNDAVFAVDVVGPERGRARRFLSAVPGAEVCGPAFDRSRRTFFCAIQHPGAGIRGSTFENPATRFPGTHAVPRSCVIAVYRADGGGIGA
jgi:secreted PhoX family phosphatase